MKNLLNNKLLISIFILGLALRFYKLEQIPNGFYVDEAVIGYNAYSFLTTGVDEYGKHFPVFLRSFGAYSSPLYTYVTVVFVKIFGLSIFSTRFLSAISGSISIAAIYFLAKEIFTDKRIGIFSSFIFAISPWSIFFSRGAYEANFALLILIISLLALLKEKYLIASFLLAINTYAYPAQRLNFLLLIAIFGIIYLFENKKSIKKAVINKKIVLSIALFIIILIPQILLIKSKASSSRAGGLFYSDVIARESEKSNALFALSREFFAQYANYFSPNNIFIVGDKDPQRSAPNISLIYSFLVLPFFVGLYQLFKNLKKYEYKIIFLLFLTFPIVPALTRDPFSSLRNLSSLIPITVITALGVNEIYLLISKRAFFVLAIFSTLFALLFLWRSYFVLLPYERSKLWSGGYSELAEIIKESPDKKFVIENNRLKPTYILLAFYLKLDPYVIQNSVDSEIKNDYYNLTDWNPIYKIANFETRDIFWKEDICKELILVGDELSVSEGQAEEHFLEKEFEIRTINNEIVFVGYKTNPKKKCKQNS